MGRVRLDILIHRNVLLPLSENNSKKKLDSAAAVLKDRSTAADEDVVEPRRGIL